MLTCFLLLSYKLAAIKLVTPSKEHLETHCSYPFVPLAATLLKLPRHGYPAEYKILTALLDADLKEKPFFPGLLSCKFFSDHNYFRVPFWLTMMKRHDERPHLRHGLGGP